MTKPLKFASALILLFVLVALAVTYFHGRMIAVLDPKGIIAEQQRDLIVVATLLMLIVVIPVFILTFTFVWQYREKNRGARYQPEWDHSAPLEIAWWGIPLAIIAILSVIIWQSSHALDPYQPLQSDVEPVEVQVVALEWKWLFIYPEHDIATVNYLAIPEDTPINFSITADAPMNSFWIPSLGGQVYAMAGMQTRLHLMADEPGEYQGSSANLSGKGFAGMKFVTHAMTEEEFSNWKTAVSSNGATLDKSEYRQLSAPSQDVAPRFYGGHDPELYATIIMKYMSPDAELRDTNPDTTDREATADSHEEHH